MNAKTQIKVMVLAVASALSALSAPLQAADAAPGATVFSGEVTAKLYSFDYFKGSGTNSTQFLERYNYQEGMGGDQRGGGYLDADLSIVGKNGQRNVFELEREGFGAHNHRGRLKADTDTLGFVGYYSNFRSATGGLNFLYSPGQIPSGGVDLLYAAGDQTGFVRQFNTDSAGQTQFRIDRTTYGLGLALKPTFFGNSAAALLNYDGYKRDGNRFATYVLGNGDLTGANAVKRPLRWRGFDSQVSEKMNRYTLSLNGAPGGFNLAYEGSIEKFDNQAFNPRTGDFNAAINAQAATVFITAPTRPIQFVPDSTLVTNNFRFAKNYGSTAVAAGYGLSVLSQDSFSAEQDLRGYSSGKITTNSAYLTVTSVAVSGVGLEGFIKYNNRDNDSQFPVPLLINPLATEGLDVHIRRIKTVDYGVSGTFRPGVLKSTLVAGWKHQDKDRDLTWSQWGGGVVSIHPLQTLLREQTQSDELYLNWVARPMPGMILRVTPAYVWAGDTGLVTEPERAFSLKTKLSYAAKDGVLTSGYYNYKNNKNANNSFTNSAAGGVLGTSVAQDVDKTQQAAGISINVPVSEWINTHASLSWMQDDFTTYFLRNDARRYDAPTAAINFASIDRPNYNVDTYVLTLGGDWQVNDELRWNGGYTWSKSKGNTASGYVFDQLAAGNSIDGTISSAVHSLNVGVDYALKKNVKLKASYVYDYNKDDSYSALTGGYHTLMMGVGFGF
ncbi:MAG: MtrB/PioB family outer membrane beta-barrel protein [Sulfuritalea sp.]|nr:MtrB/PioB family outer membrane beta-barrel protein [Sulfuritalea sp.]